MLIPKTNVANLRELLARLNECSFDQYQLHTAVSKWTISALNPDTNTRRFLADKLLTTREAIIALCVTLETMQSIQTKSWDDGYQSAVMDAGTPGRGEV